jgi:CHAT domain-containing protein/Tfp pilus assembly protein PilF
VRRGFVRPRAFSLALLCVAFAPARAGAQAWARLDVPAPQRADAMRAAASTFEAAWSTYEAAWNALLVAQLRAERTSADSAAALLRLANAIAREEPAALGSRIAPEALALRSRWDVPQRRARVAAAVAESLGAAAQRAGDWGAADSLLGAALATYRQLGERRREAWVLGSMGQNALSGRRVAAADSLYRLALVARRRIGDAKLVGNTLNSLGSTAYELRRFGEARDWYEQARIVREGTGERGPLANTLGFLGNTARALGRPDTARVLYDSALALATAAGDSAIVSSVLINSSGLYAEQGEPAPARAQFDRALAIVRSRGDRRREAVLTTLLGDLQRQSGRFVDAVATLERAASLARANRDPVALRSALISLGRTWLELEDPEAARAPLTAALALADSTGDETARGRVLSNLALCAKLEGDRTVATRFAQDALRAGRLAADSVTTHTVEVTLGQLALDRDDGEEAARWFEAAARSGAGLDAESRAADLGNLGIAAGRRGRLDEAEAHYRAALALADATGSPDMTWHATLGLGDVAERRGDVAGALAHDRRAATLIDTLRSHQGAEAPAIALFASRLFAYEALIHLLGKLDAARPESGYAAEAFQWSERSRARALVDLLAASEAAPGAAAPALLSLAQARAALPSREDALLEYSVGDSSSSLWVVTRGKWKRLTLPARPALRLRVETLRRLLADPERSDSRAAHAAARALYAMLIEPAQPLLGGVRHLLISPDGPLALLPFEALLARDDGGEGPAMVKAWLASRYEISYVPSASALAAIRGGYGGDAVVALGDPCFACGDSSAARPELPAPLPHTRAELEALQEFCAGRPLALLSGRDATRSRLLALPTLARAGLIHLATHGVADETRPERSGLFLAPEPGDAGPGFLSLRDIVGLRLDAALVTLSACETGLGRVERGEGVLGLTRAFLAAGARSAVVSLWSVNDGSSAVLMSAFYRELLGKGLPRSSALASARRTLLRDPDTRAPFHWAPFVLVGEWGAVARVE